VLFFSEEFVKAKKCFSGMAVPASSLIFTNNPPLSHRGKAWFSVSERAFSSYLNISSVEITMTKEGGGSGIYEF
jgi:hypothetical protein